MVHAVSEMGVSMAWSIHPILFLRSMLVGNPTEKQNFAGVKLEANESTNMLIMELSSFSLWIMIVRTWMDLLFLIASNRWAKTGVVAVPALKSRWANLQLGWLMRSATLPDR